MNLGGVAILILDLDVAVVVTVVVVSFGGSSLDIPLGSMIMVFPVSAFTRIVPIYPVVDSNIRVISPCWEHFVGLSCIS